MSHRSGNSSRCPATGARSGRRPKVRARGRRSASGARTRPQLRAKHALKPPTLTPPSAPAFCPMRFVVMLPDDLGEALRQDGWASCQSSSRLALALEPARPSVIVTTRMLARHDTGEPCRNLQRRLRTERLGQGRKPFVNRSGVVVGDVVDPRWTSLDGQSASRPAPTSTFANFWAPPIPVGHVDHLSCVSAQGTLALTP
jgi:hypothetical protein